MPSKEGSPASAAVRVSRTRCPRAPAGGLSDAASTSVNTPRNGSRFGCPATRCISRAIDSNSMFIFVLLSCKKETAWSGIHSAVSNHLRFNTEVVEPPQSKRSVRARVQPDVNQLVIIQRDLRLRSIPIGHLHIVRRTGQPIPIALDANRRAIDRPERQRMFEIAGALDFDRAETSDDHVLQNLLGQGAERIIRIGRIEIVSEDAYAQICIRQLFSATRPWLNSPPHPGNLIFDRVDRLSRHRRFSKTSQVGWRRLWVRIGPRTIGVQDGRQGHGSPPPSAP